MGARAGLVAATPELLASVEALPPLRGEPDVDLVEATTDDGRSSLRRLVRRFRWPLVARRRARHRRRGHDARRAAADPPRPRRRRVGAQRHGAGGDVPGSSSACSCVSWGNQIVELLHTSRTAERMLFTLRARTFAHLQRLSLDYYDKEMGGRIMTRMTTDVEALAQLLQQGLLLAMTSIIGCAGVVVILLVLDVRLALVAFVVLPVLAAVTIWFQQASRHVVPAGPRRHLDRQRRDAGERGRRARHPVAGPGRQQRRAVHRPLRAVPRRPAALDAADVDLLRQQPAAEHVRQGPRALVRRPPDRPGDADVGSADRLPALPRPVLLPAAAAVGGVRPVDPGPGLARSPRRAAGHADVDAGAGPPRRPRRVGRQRAAARVSASPTPPRRRRRCAASTCASRPARAWPSSARRAPGSRRSSSSSPASTTPPAAGCSSTTSTCATSTSTPTAATSATCPRSRTCSRARSARTSPTAGPQASDLEVERAARAVGAHDLVASMPDGYLTSVAEAGRSLSAGQRQLLCLARAQLIDPSILILDEATSNLDLATEAVVQRAMNLAAQGRTTLIIAHRLQTARHANRIVVVDDGRVVEDGSHDEPRRRRRPLRRAVGRLRQRRPLPRGRRLTPTRPTSPAGPDPHACRDRSACCGAPPEQALRWHEALGSTARADVAIPAGVPDGSARLGSHARRAARSSPAARQGPRRRPLPRAADRRRPGPGGPALARPLQPGVPSRRSASHRTSTC